jgi:hypothetical protein
VDITSIQGAITAPDAGNGCEWADVAAVVEAMRGGNTYVTAHTNDGVDPPDTGPGDFPGGEIRGQIQAAAIEPKQVTLNPSKDNTLYQDTNGALSNGAGQHFFVGNTNNGSIRRGIIAFDIAGTIPAGATINSLTLTLYLSRTLSDSPQPVALHKLLADWGEGASDASDNEGSGIGVSANRLHGFGRFKLQITRTGRVAALEVPRDAMMLVDTAACATQSVRAPVPRASVGPLAHSGTAVGRSHPRR